MNGAIQFADIVQYGTTGKIYYDHLSDQLSKDTDLKDYPSLLQKNDQVRKKIEKEAQEFIMEIFSEKFLRIILSTVFFNQYEKKWEKEFEDYRINIATLMIEYATELLQRHAKLNVLFGYLNDTREIARFVRDARQENRTSFRRKRS